MMNSPASRIESDNPTILIDIEEAAYILSCSRALIYKFINQGKLTRVKIGRSARLRREEVLAMTGV